MDLKKITIFILALGITLVISDIVHESGHAFFGVIGGLEIIEYAPYPHIEQGNVYLGHVSFKNYDVSDEYLALMYIGSAIFQGGMFILLSIIYFFLNKKDILPPSEKSKKFNLTIFADYSIKLYSIWGLIDWPLYAINHALKLPHFFIAGGPWDAGDIYLFAKYAGIYEYFYIILVIAIAWLILGALFLYYVQYYLPKKKKPNS